MVEMCKGKRPVRSNSRRSSAGNALPLLRNGSAKSWSPNSGVSRVTSGEGMTLVLVGKMQRQRARPFVVTAADEAGAASEFAGSRVLLKEGFRPGSPK